MKRTSIISAMAALAILAGACGGGDDNAGDTTTSTTDADQTTVTSDGSTTTQPSTTETSTTGSTSSTSSEPTTSTSGAKTTDQPAIWPAVGVVFDSPDAAAADFVSEVLGVPPNLGEFQQGDARSGEIEVFSPGEGGGTSVSRSVLLLRQLGPDDGWFVLAAVNENASITTPASGAEVASGDLEVSGEARGFEAAVVVEAFVAGDADSRIAQQITQGGSAATPEPYSVTLDLSGTSAGTTVIVLVRGGTGLETDPGEFSAIPVVIG